ncbi:HEAT repeat domain-containing protein [Streptomyces sp. CB01881]|uniref:NACHT domain-containing protein n=1 Tax=Streptomyces sp. CB01881 TaxID=2078691 RepID=UPI001386C1EF|nr:HEAT repeat domain-containing protein [Streptomyces sp. CB01881]
MGPGSGARAWQPWPRANERELVRFVTPRANRWLPVEVSRYDLSHQPDRCRDVAAAIYDALSGRNIRYALEEYHPSGALQAIRTPAEVLGAPREGTCLDLAALFCGLCLAYDLLPVLVVVDGHAFALFCTTHGLPNRSDYDRPGRELFAAGPVTNAEQLTELVDSGRYLAVECTGFARSDLLGKYPNLPEARHRTDGLLPFDQAVLAGREQLDQADRPLRFAIDIATAHYEWRIEPHSVKERSPAAKAQERSEQIAAAVEVYRGRVREKYRRLNLDVLGPSASAGEQAVIELRQVFMPQLSRPYTAQVPGEWRRLLAAGAMEDGELPPGVEAEEAARRREAYHAQAARPVLEVLAGEEGRRLVVLGDPGAGKSTLAQYVALALAGGLDDLPPEIARLNGLVPVMVELRTYAQAQWRERTFEDFLEHTHDVNKMGLARVVLKGLLADERVVMLFDGLDEVFDPGVRADVAERITAFAAAHPGVRTVVTSREYGYRPGDFAPHGFAQVMLQDLERRQIEEFVPRWYTAAHPAEPELADQLARRLLGAVRQIRAVAELAGNPLLLTVLASMGLGRTIPRERRKVYAHAIQVLIERWDKEAKFLTAPSPAAAEAVTALEWLNVDQRLLLLERIARHMQEGAGQPAGTFIRHKELTALISTFIIDGTANGISRPAADIATERLVEQLRTRNFLLAHYGDGVYGFVHRTFLEYLAARDLLRRRTEEELDREEVVDLLAAHADDPAWHEVILLTAGGLTKRDAAALLARLLDLHRAAETFWDASMLTLAIRVLAEIDDLQTTPNTTDLRLSITAQSNAVVDALIDHTHNSLFLTVDEALPALGTFDRFWSGRPRYLHHYYASMAFGSYASRRVSLFFGLKPDPGDVAAALSSGRAETLWMERIPWYPGLRSAALRVLGERWPDHEDTRQTVLTAATTASTESVIRAAALRVLGKRWPDHEDTRQTVLTTATTDTATSPGVRRTALQVLGERWPDHEDTRQTVLTTATTDTDPDVRTTALQVLGERWPDHEDTRQTVLTATTDTESVIRAAALQVLGERWPDHEDSRQTVLTTATTDTESVIRAAALQVLGQRWPDHEDSRQTVLTATTDTDPDVRRTALQVLGERWPDHEDSRQTVLTTATTDTESVIRAAALQVLGQRWPDHEDSRQTVLTTATTDTESVIRAAALHILDRRWPSHEETRRTARTATTDTSPEVRNTALEVLAARFGNVAYPIVCQHAHHSQPAGLRVNVAKALALLWPQEPGTVPVLTDMTGHPEEDVRTTAEQALALVEYRAKSVAAGGM